MKILQICSYYSGSQLYRNLFETLDEVYLNQEIFVPYQKKNNNLFFNRYYPSLINGSISYTAIWDNYNRILYRNKIKKAIYYLSNTNKQYELINAHTWFSDGGIAYELNKINFKPYLISIRNTDINYFYKYRFDLRRYSHKILLNASKIILISPSYKKTLEKLLPKRIYLSIEGKLEIIPNGIDSFWFNNIPNSFNPNWNKDLIYIGDIRSNKNIELLIKSFLKVSSNPEIGKLKLVGCRNKTNYERTLKNRYSSNVNIEFYDRKTKEELKELLRDSHIFIMVSKKETFGLVYIEALSQGLPIIYSKGQGVDGYFGHSNIGEKADSKSMNEVSNAMIKISRNYEEYQKHTISESLKFNWKKIGLKYLEVYKSVI